MEQLIAWFDSNGAPLLEALTQFVGAFAIIATMTPNKNDNALVAFLLKVINLFGANVGKAENK